MGRVGDGEGYCVDDGPSLPLRMAHTLVTLTTSARKYGDDPAGNAFHWILIFKSSVIPTQRTIVIQSCSWGSSCPAYQDTESFVAQLVADVNSTWSTLAAGSILKPSVVLVYMQALPKKRVSKRWSHKKKPEFDPGIVHHTH